jgi:hypothetical protein
MPEPTPVVKNSQGKWLAWCEPCQDGYQGGKVAANRWAANHDVTEAHKARTWQT